MGVTSHVVRTFQEFEHLRKKKKPDFNSSGPFEQFLTNNSYCSCFPLNPSLPVKKPQTMQLSETSVGHRWAGELAENGSQ